MTEPIEGCGIMVGFGQTPVSPARVTAIASDGHEAKLLTCAHAFEAGFDRVFLPGTTLVVATLERDMRNEDPPRDVVVARLTSAGLAALGDFRVLPLGPPAGLGFVLRDGQRDQTEIGPKVYNALFFPSGPYLRTRYIGEDEGDSGAPLIVLTPGGPRLCGMHRGAIPINGKKWSLYTPLAGIF